MSSLEACPLAVTSSCAAKTVSQTASRATPGWSARRHLVRLYSTRGCQVLLAMADATLQGSGALRGCSRERLSLDSTQLGSNPEMQCRCFRLTLERIGQLEARISVLEDDFDEAALEAEVSKPLHGLTRNCQRASLLSMKPVLPFAQRPA